ncbi:MAG: glutamine-synthetase adenylyltransferase [Bryobacterales bacterium]|nr:glutamine-synthetase adenylyltransferase [Bryobacterales bacterium]
MPAWVDEIAFRAPERARAHALLLQSRIPDTSLDRIRYLLESAPDPDRALDYLTRLWEHSPDMFARLTRTAAGLQSLVAVFCQSAFLSEEVLQRPEWLEEVCASGELFRSLSLETMTERLERFLPEGVPDAVLLARFRRREMLRILLRDVRGLAPLPEVAGELSTLAGAVLEVSYRRVREALETRHGTPKDGDGRICGFSVLAMGKLGGEELNYSSDIDLMFVYSGTAADGNQEFFRKLAHQLTELLSSYTAEGMCYRVDLRLRPDGRLGELCLSLAAAKQYYQTRGRDWELQMLIKARVAAGETEPGRQLLAFVEPLIYATSLDFSAIETVSAARLRQHERLAERQRRGPQEIDVKLCEGGIRDVEFLVQCLQRLHGGRERWVRHGGTMLALARLRDKDLLSATEYARLASAYQFLRTLEHRLQFADDRQTHSLPLNEEELEAVGRRMPGRLRGAGLLAELEQHLEEVAEIYRRVIHAQQPSGAGMEESGGQPISNLVRFLTQIAPGLAATIARRASGRGAVRFEHFLEKVRQTPEWLGLMDQDTTLAGQVIDLFDASPFLSEELLRTPDLLAEFALFGSGPGEPPEGAGAGELRRWFRREMFRAQSESVCLRRPVFETLEQTSQLGERVMAAAYEVAVRMVSAAHPPEAVNYRARKQMMVVALGRLGMREFDLGSDADLFFVLPNRDAIELPFWTRVAEKMIDVISAYTGEGVIFAVDTRLRPNGREGSLVQTERAFRDYFERTAEAWEGMAYMKAHAVAGDLEAATAFLNDLQEIDWRRYGQSGRSRGDLRKMRLRLQRELGDANLLKAGEGGYYDIDFVLMYLRLKSAGIFFKQLNTPRRIDVVEKMGHLERADAAFLREAATFYRAVDHGLRLIHGHAAGSLPKAAIELETLADLVGRWREIEGGSLVAEWEAMRVKTREVFERLFGG